MLNDEETKAKLNQLSKELYGTPNYWRRLLTKGQPLVPPDQLKADYKGIRFRVAKHYTLDEVLAKLEAEKETKAAE